MKTETTLKGLAAKAAKLGGDRAKAVIQAGATAAATELAGIAAEAVAQGIRLAGTGIRNRMDRGEAKLLAWIEGLRAKAGARE
jgi:hypothetical protein